MIYEIYKEIFRCFRNTSKYFVEQSEYEPRKIKIPWLLLTADDEDITNQINDSLKVGDLVNTEYIAKFLQRPCEKIVYLTHTLEELDFPSAGLVIEDEPDAKNSSPSHSE